VRVSIAHSSRRAHSLRSCAQLLLSWAIDNFPHLLHNILFFFFFFFFFKLPFPFFAIRLLRYLSVGRFSNSCSLFLCLSVMRRGSGALSPATHAHSTSHSQTYTTTFIHPWAPFPTGLEPVLTSRWWPKEC
jgi:hypothetical protein